MKYYAILFVLILTSFSLAAPEYALVIVGPRDRGGVDASLRFANLQDCKDAAREVKNGVPYADVVCVLHIEPRPTKKKIRCNLDTKFVAGKGRYTDGTPYPSSLECTIE